MLGERRLLFALGVGGAVGTLPPRPNSTLDLDEGLVEDTPVVLVSDTAPSSSAVALEHWI